MMSDFHHQSVVCYWKWLDRVCPKKCKRFLAAVGNERDREGYEGALVEAIAWNWLASRCEVHLHETEDAGGVDFRCESDAGAFYAEVSAITTGKMTRATGLRDGFEQGAQFYRPATQAIWEKVQSKSKQAAGLSDPVVLFLATLHARGSAATFDSLMLEELLLGTRKIVMSYDQELGEAIGEPSQVATLESSLFFNYKPFNVIRPHVSAVLVAGFGWRPRDVNAHGVLHPAAHRPFLRDFLPDVCFGHLDPWPPSSEVRVLWQRMGGCACDDEGERQRSMAAAEYRLRKAGYGQLLDECRRRADGETEVAALSEG